MAASSGSRPIPYPWSEVYVGRVVREKSGRQGVIKYNETTMGHGHCPEHKRRKFGGLAMEFDFTVFWEDGTVSSLPDDQIARLATQRFAEEEWVLPVLRYLQRRNWAGHDKGVEALTAEAEEEEKQLIKERKAAERKEAAAAKRRASAGAKAKTLATAARGKGKSPAAAKGTAAMGGHKRAAPKAAGGGSAAKKPRAGAKKTTVLKPSVKIGGLAAKLATRTGVQQAGARSASATGGGASGSNGGCTGTASVGVLGGTAAAEEAQLALDQGNGEGASTSMAAAAEVARQPPVTSPLSPRCRTLSGNGKLTAAGAAQQQQQKGKQQQSAQQQQKGKQQQSAQQQQKGKQQQSAQQQQQNSKQNGKQPAARQRAAQGAAPGSSSGKKQKQQTGAVAAAGTAARTDAVPREREDLAARPVVWAMTNDDPAGEYPHDVMGGKKKSARLFQEGDAAGPPTSAAAAAALRPDELAAGSQPLWRGHLYTYTWAGSTLFYKYNLLDGPGGKQWRVYCRDIMVPDAASCLKEDRPCREWKLKDHGDVDYEVSAIVGQREHPQLGTQYLVKWKEFELDLDDDNWLVEGELGQARKKLKEWKGTGRAAFQEAVQHFIAAA